MVVISACCDGAEVRVLRRLRDPEGGFLEYGSQWSRPMSWAEMDVQSRSAAKALAVVYGCMGCGTVRMLPVLMEVRG